MKEEHHCINSILMLDGRRLDATTRHWQREQLTYSKTTNTYPGEINVGHTPAVTYLKGKKKKISTDSYSKSGEAHTSPTHTQLHSLNMPQ